MLLGNVQCLFHWMLFYRFSCILQHPFWQVKLSHHELIDVTEEPWEDYLQLMWCCALVPSVSLSTRGVCSSCVGMRSASPPLREQLTQRQQWNRLSEKVWWLPNPPLLDTVLWVPLRYCKAVLSRNAAAVLFRCTVGSCPPPPMVPGFQAAVNSPQDLVCPPN